MIELQKNELLEISGGASWFSASFINALARGMEVILDAGRSLGTAIVRIINGKQCKIYV